MAVASVYAIVIEPNWIHVKQIHVNQNQFSAFFNSNNVILLSDIHVSSSGIREKLLLRKITQIDPDYIFLTGDYISWQGNYDQTFDFLKKLKAKKGIYGVLGDADYRDSRKSCIFCHRFNRDDPILPVRILKNQEILIGQGASKIKIIGIEPFRHNFIHGKKLVEKKSDVPAIVLSHQQVDFNGSNNTNLVLSGDTHGGQIYMPDFFWEKLFGKKKGSIRHGINVNQTIIVTKGIGTSRLPFRFLCRPEIIILK